MKALDHLKHFIAAKNNAEERPEIREYLLATLAELAPEFGVSEDKLRGAIDAIGDDSASEPLRRSKRC